MSLGDSITFLETQSQQEQRTNPFCPHYSWQFHLGLGRENKYLSAQEESQALGAVPGPRSSALLDDSDAHRGILGPGWQHGSLQVHTSAQKVQSDYSPLQKAAGFLSENQGFKVQ